MSSVNKPLKYLFQVLYRDGGAFMQPAHDTSISKIVCNECGDHSDSTTGLCPNCGSDNIHYKSAFADVRMDDVETFMLYEGLRLVAAVCLSSGMFYVGGQWFSVAPQNHVFTEPLKLVFFREVHRTQTFNATVQDDLSVSADVAREEVSVKRYFIGWETRGMDGKKLERTIAIE